MRTARPLKAVLEEILEKNIWYGAFQGYWRSVSTCLKQRHVIPWRLSIACCAS